MPSVTPITVNDLNGVEFNPGEMIIDDVAGYVGYVRSLCTDLGTEKDTKGGRKDYLDFQSEIQSAHISTFEPDFVDVKHSFEALDLTGSQQPIREYPTMAYNVVINNRPFLSYANWITPFDFKEKSVPQPDNWVSPFDIPEFVDMFTLAQKKAAEKDPDLR
jgi:hypothetical protein